jgi:hydrogenase maturation protein HypF
MLPYTPLHHILLREFECPIVMTSGNMSHEPQAIANSAAREKLADIADYWLFNDRDIVNRLDDSVVRMIGANRQTLRRARGYAPSRIALPQDFENAPFILAMGAELKNSFCLIKDGQAILSQHMGDLADAATHEEYRKTLTLYRRLFDFQPSMIAVDLHPGYHSSQWGVALGDENGWAVAKVQHHHAHIAACMAEHGLPLSTDPVLGIALDGLGLGEEEQIWGGEFLLADYAGYERLACFAPVPLFGGERAMLEPWRNAYAHLKVMMGWDRVCRNYPQLEIVRFLQTRPLQILDTMSERGVNSPSACSAGRLFDAAAAMLGIHRDRLSFEGQAAMQLEALAADCSEPDAGYYHCSLESGEPAVLHWGLMWRELLDDLKSGTNKALVAWRFHNSVTAALVRMVQQCARHRRFETIVLSGGVFQNRLLLEGVIRDLEILDYKVLVPCEVPANDGGISLGQGVIAAARHLQRQKVKSQ